MTISQVTLRLNTTVSAIANISDTHASLVSLVPLLLDNVTSSLATVNETQINFESARSSLQNANDTITGTYFVSISIFVCVCLSVCPHKHTHAHTHIPLHNNISTEIVTVLQPTVFGNSI